MKEKYEAPRVELVCFEKSEKAETMSIDGFDIRASWLRSGS